MNSMRERTSHNTTSKRIEGRKKEGEKGRTAESHIDEFDGSSVRNTNCYLSEKESMISLTSELVTYRSTVR